MVAHFRECALYSRPGWHTQCGATFRRRTRLRGSRRGWPTVIWQTEEEPCDVSGGETGETLIMKGGLKSRRNYVLIDHSQLLRTCLVAPSPVPRQLFGSESLARSQDQMRPCWRTSPNQRQVQLQGFAVQ